MAKKFAGMLVLVLLLGAAGAAQAADNPVHTILQTLGRNLTAAASKTYTYALDTLNPVYPGTVNAINALDRFHREAKQFQALMTDPAVSDTAIQNQVTTLSLTAKQTAFALNALGAHPALQPLVTRWNQTIDVLRQIKVYVPASRDAERALNFAALHQ